jgi:hypothetical protein
MHSAARSGLPSIKPGAGRADCVRGRGLRQRGLKVKQKVCVLACKRVKSVLQVYKYVKVSPA